MQKQIKEEEGFATDTKTTSYKIFEEVQEMLRKHRLFYLTLITLLGLSLLSACTEQNTTLLTTASMTATTGVTTESTTAGPEPLTEISLPISDQGIELTIYSAMSQSMTNYISSFSETPVVKEMEKRTGLKLTFMHPSVGQETTQFNLLVASGDYPDIFYMMFDQYKGGVDAAINEKVLIDVEPLVNLYAPNFKKIFLDDPENAKFIRSDAGILTGFGKYFYGTGMAYVGPLIRKDYLTKVNLPMPETMDDWYKVLTAFKNELNLPVPLGLTYGKDGGMMAASYTFIGAYDLSLREFCQHDGKIIFSPIDPKFKDFLATMNKWYKEGLINKDFVTEDYGANIVPLMKTGELGAAPTHLWYLGNLYSEIKAANPEADWEATVMPKLQAGQEVKLRNAWMGLYGGKYISTKCKNPVEAVQFIDWLYTDEADLLTNWGIEGESYFMANGMPEFLPDILKDTGKLDALYSNGYLKQSIDMRQANGAYPLAEQHFAWAQWEKASTDFMLPPDMTFTDSENTIKANLMTDINTYTDEMTVKFMTGVESLDNFDNFVAKVKEMKIDEVIKVYQDALDRFNSR